MRRAFEAMYEQGAGFIVGGSFMALLAMCLIVGLGDDRQRNMQAYVNKQKANAIFVVGYSPVSGNYELYDINALTGLDDFVSNKQEGHVVTFHDREKAYKLIKHLRNEIEKWKSEDN